MMKGTDPVISENIPHAPLDEQEVLAHELLVRPVVRVHGLDGVHRLKEVDIVNWELLVQLKEGVKMANSGKKLDFH